MPDNDGYHGSQQPENTSGDYNAMAFVIRSILAERNHVALVKVVHVDATGGLALAGTVDVQPLVNQLDGQGNAIPHGVVNGLPYTRMQGGLNAFIMDPQVGDIGLVLFCDRDISSVQATRNFANPASARRSDMADGVYLGGLLNAIPNQYVMFTSAGIKIVSPTLVDIEAPEIDLIAPVIKMNASTSVTITTPTFTVNGASQFNGNATSTGTLTGQTDVIGGGKSLKSHVHTGVASGTSTSGPPQ